MNPQKTSAQNRRPTIDLLATLIEDANGAALWAGVVDAARDHDVNLVCFTGRELCDEKEPFQTALAAQQSEILTAIEQSLGTSESSAEQVARLWDAFLAEISETQEKPSGAFLSELNSLLEETVESGGNVNVWHAALSALRRQVLPHLWGDEAALLQAEDLWQQARTLISEATERKQGFIARQEEQRSQEFLQIGQTLATASSVADLTEALVDELIRLEIPRGYLALYEDPQLYSYPDPAPKWSRLVLANTIENTRLFRQTQEALKEIESFQRLQVRDVWSRHISRQEQ